MLGFEALGPASAPADSAADESFGDRLKRWLRDARPGQQEPAPAVKNVELSENAGEVDEDMCDDDAVDVGSMGSGRRAGASARPSWMGGMWLAVPKRKPSYARKRRRQMNPLYANDKTLDVRAKPCCWPGLVCPHDVIAGRLSLHACCQIGLLLCMPNTIMLLGGPLAIRPAPRRRLPASLPAPFARALPCPCLCSIPAILAAAPAVPCYPVQHAYPCPKCAKGLIKLRHHLCPCDQEALNCRAVVKVRYGIAKRRVAAEEAAAAKAAAAAAAPAAATPSA